MFAPAPSAAVPTEFSQNSQKGGIKEGKKDVYSIPSRDLHGDGHFRQWAVAADAAVAGREPRLRQKIPTVWLDAAIGLADGPGMRLSGGWRPDEISLQFGEDVLPVGELTESRDVRADFVDEGPALEKKRGSRGVSGKRKEMRKGDCIFRGTRKSKKSQIIEI